jgi:hypothetical protein
MSFKVTDDLSSDSDTSFTSAMDAESPCPQQHTQQALQQQAPPQQAPQQASQQAPQQAPTFDSAVKEFVDLCTAGMLSNKQFATVISASKNVSGAAAPNNIEDQCIQQRLAK